MFLARTLACSSLSHYNTVCGSIHGLTGATQCGISSHRVQASSHVEKSRKYPDEPRVGIGVVAFRPGTPLSGGPEVLLIKRGKEPAKGMWSFPGGSLELGESMVACAMRELEEETGLKLQNKPGSGNPRSLHVPKPFAAVEVITPDKNDPSKVAFHYVIVEVAGLAENPQQPVLAAGDVDAAHWVAAKDLNSWPGLVPNIKAMVTQALERFDVE